MPICRRRLVLAASFGLFAVPAAGQGPGGAVDLGTRWQVREQTPGGRYWDGVWTRRGDSNVFDAEWRDGESGATIRDTIEFQGREGPSIVLYRRGVNGRYTGRILPDGRQVSGTASWYTPGSYWTALIHRE